MTLPTAVTSGVTSCITVTARDVTGKVLSRGGESVTVGVTPECDTSVTDNGDGTSTVTLISDRVGKLSVKVLVNGTQIQGYNRVV